MMAKTEPMSLVMETLQKSLNKRQRVQINNESKSMTEFSQTQSYELYCTLLLSAQRGRGYIKLVQLVEIALKEEMMHSSREFTQRRP